MRAVIVFSAGFAAGVVFLAVLLWQTGGLLAHYPPAARPKAIVQTPPPISPPAVPLPNSEKSPAPGPLNPPPEQAMRIAPAGQPSLLIPVRGVGISQLHDNFSEMRDGHLHQALDIMAPRGTPVVAAEEGDIVKLFNSKPGGLTIYQFDDTQTYCFYYAHLDRYAPGVQEGTLVRRGEVIGYVGSTGDAPANAPHLHFGVSRLGPDKHWWQGTPIDPYPLLNEK